MYHSLTAIAWVVDMLQSECLRKTYTSVASGWLLGTVNSYAYQGSLY